MTAGIKNRQLARKTKKKRSFAKPGQGKFVYLPQVFLGDL